MILTKHDPDGWYNHLVMIVSNELMGKSKEQIYNYVSGLDSKKLTYLMTQSLIKENYEVCSAIQTVLDERKVKE